MASAGAAAGQRRSAAHVLRPIVGVLLFLVLWEVVSLSGLLAAPPPSAVSLAMMHLLGERMFLADAVSTVLPWLVAVVLATLIGVVVGLVLGSLPWLRTASTMVVEFVLPLPAVALIPLVVALLGANSQAKITLAVFAAVWPVLCHTLHGLGELDPQFAEVARSYRVAWWRTVLWVTIPAILPCVRSGVRFAASVALMSLIGTEFLTGGGLGQFIRQAGSLDLVLAATLFAGLLGLLANVLIGTARRRIAGTRHE
jgi:NitT/TauT family transport system permease protein